MLELVRASSSGEHRIERIKDTPVLRLRNKLLPLIHLKEILQLGRGEGDKGFVVVTQVGSQIFGIVVDGVFHTEEIVIKPMSSKLRHIAAFSGTTILGDGTVIMIIDPNGIAQALGRAHAGHAGRSRPSSTTAACAEEDLTPLLVFRAGSQQPKAVLLVAGRRGSRRSIAARSKSPTAVIWCNTAISSCRCCASTRRPRIKQDGAQPILVFSDRGRSMGLVVDEIVDIVEERLDIEVASDRPGVLGYAVVKGSATEIIDIGHFLPQAFADWFRRRDERSTPARAPRAAGRRLGLFPRHAGAADQGRRLSGRRRRIGRARR